MNWVGVGGEGSGGCAKREETRHEMMSGRVDGMGWRSRVHGVYMPTCMPCEVPTHCPRSSYIIVPEARDLPRHCRARILTLSSDGQYSGVK